MGPPVQPPRFTIALALQMQSFPARPQRRDPRVRTSTSVRASFSRCISENLASWIEGAVSAR